MEQSSTAFFMEFAADGLGLASSIVLLVTAWKAAPIQALLDKAAELDAKKPGGRLLVTLSVKSQEDLAKVRGLERRYLLAGTWLLLASFLTSSIARFA